MLHKKQKKQPLTAKEYLRNLRRLDQQCGALLTSIEELHSRITRVTPTISHAPKSGGGLKKDQKMMAQMIDLKAEFRGKMDEYLELKKKVFRQINELKDSRHQLVLMHYYVNGKTWEETAVEMKISYRWVLSLHGQALKEFEKLHGRSL